MKQQYLEVGKITNVHGLMGEVRVQPWADSADFLCRFKTLYVDETHWPIQVERARVHKNMVILKLEGITDVNGALALRNAILPVVTYVGPMLAGLMTGSFVVEKIFSIPGLGRDFVSAITNRDYMMIMGTTILLATLVIVANVIVDILYKIIDPRIKLK